MKLHAVRLVEGQDLKQAIVAFAQAENVSAGVVVSAVGSLSIAKLRMAGAQPEHQDIREYTGVFEIVSLIGSITGRGEAHLHMSIADVEGRVYGGHLKDGCIVHTTVELVIANEESLTFSREVDQATGFDELMVVKIGK